MHSESSEHILAEYAFSFGSLAINDTTETTSQPSSSRTKSGCVFPIDESLFRCTHAKFLTEQFSACALGWRTSFTNANYNASWPTSSVTMSGPSTMTGHCVLELPRNLTTSCTLCDINTKKFPGCPHSTCDVSQVELKVHIPFLSHCNHTLLVQRCASVRHQRLKHNLAGDTIDPKFAL